MYNKDNGTKTKEIQCKIIYGYAIYPLHLLFFTNTIFSLIHLFSLHYQFPSESSGFMLPRAPRHFTRFAEIAFDVER